MISFMSGPFWETRARESLRVFRSISTSIVLGGVFAVLGTLSLAFLLPGFVNYDGREGLRIKEEADNENSAAK